MLVCSTTEEAAFFLELAPKLRALTATPLIGPAIRFGLVRVASDAVYTWGGRRFARLLARAGARVQVARFDGQPEGSSIGSAHAIELALLFPNSAAWAPARLLQLPTAPSRSSRRAHRSARRGASSPAPG